MEAPLLNTKYYCRKYFKSVNIYSSGRVRAKLSAPLATMGSAKTDSRGRSRTKMVSQSQRMYCSSAPPCLSVCWDEWVTLYYCVRRWAVDKFKADFKSNKPHTEFLFCTLGSSSPDKNEGIFLMFWVSCCACLGFFLSGCCLVFVLLGTYHWPPPLRKKTFIFYSDVCMEIL